MYRHYTILNHLIHHPMNQKQACICQAHHHGMPVLSFPLIQAWAIYLQMNYHPLHHLGWHCNRHQILITKFLVSTFFAIFYFRGPHISFLRWHWYLEALAITPWYPIFQFDIKWLPICSNISHIWRFLLQFQAWYIWCLSSSRLNRMSLSCSRIHIQGNHDHECHWSSAICWCKDYLYWSALYFSPSLEIT